MQPSPRHTDYEMDMTIWDRRKYSRHRTRGAPRLPRINYYSARLSSVQNAFLDNEHVETITNIKASRLLHSTMRLRTYIAKRESSHI